MKNQPKKKELVKLHKWFEKFKIPSANFDFNSVIEVENVRTSSLKENSKYVKENVNHKFNFRPEPQIFKNDYIEPIFIKNQTT